MSIDQYKAKITERVGSNGMRGITGEELKEVFMAGADAMQEVQEQTKVGINLGFLTPSSPAAPATGIHRGQASEAGTYTNFGGIVVTSAELLANFVYIEVTNGVSKKVLSAKPVADPAKLPLYSAIKGANIAATTQFIDDENGFITYRVKTGQTLNVGELPINFVDTKVNIVGSSNTVNSLTAGGSNAPLSAEMGKVLASRMTYGKNLFNKDTVTPGFYVNQSTGVLTANATMNASDFILIGGMSSLIESHANQAAYFDKNKVYVGAKSSSTALFTPPQNSVYVRVSVSNTNLNTYQLEQGAVATSYEPYKVTIPGFKITDAEVLNSIQKNTDDILKLPPKSIKKIMQSLRNPFVRTNIKLIGDSITAGVGGTGYALTGDIIYGAERMNALTATNWANMLHNYIALKFNKDFRVGFSHPSIINTTDGNVFAINFSGGLRLNNLTTDKHLQFTFYGTNFDINYIAASSNGILDIFIDGVLHGSLDSYSASQVNSVYSVTGLTLAKHTVTISETNTKNASSSGKKIDLRFLRIPKTATVLNYGLSGRTSLAVYGLRADLIKSTDDIVICMLGANDRKVENGVVELDYSLKSLYNHTVGLGASFILMSSNASTVADESKPEYYSKMADVDNIIRNVAFALNIDFVSNYQDVLEYCSYRGVALSTLVTTDGLHPNDAGYKFIYENVMRKLGLPLIADGV